MSRRIIIAYSNLDIGGIPTKIVDIANEMGKFNPEISVSVLLQKGKTGDLRSLIRNPNARVVDLPYPFAFGRSVAYVFWLWWWILTHKPSSILAFISPYALPVLLAKRAFFWKKFRVVVSEDHYTETVLGRMAIPWLQRLGIRLLYPHADAIITPTEAVKTQLVRISPGSQLRITVVPNWTRFADRPLPKTKRIFDIIHIGRLARSKNVMQVIHIMEQYVRKYPIARCAVVGDGPERKNIERYIHDNRLKNNIALCPATSNVYPYLSKAKTFLFLPEPATEGFPITLLEAMACGAVAITVRFSGVDEVITHAVNGLICTSALPDATIRSLKASQLTSIRTRAKRYVKTHHSLMRVKQYVSAMGAK